MATRTRGANVPPGYDPSEFPAFAVTVDMVILTMAEGVLHVLLVRRGQEPFEGMWATPGGFKRPDETLDEAARRELAEETGVDVPSLLTQFGAYGDPGRDPRMNVVTVGYLAVLRDVGAIIAGTDAAHAALVPASDILEERIELAFDHLRIVRDAVERVRVELEVSGIATAFVGTTFTMAELRAVYEAIWGVQLDAANFRRSLVGEDGWVIPTGRTARPGPGGGRPAELYRAGRAWKHGAPIPAEPTRGSDAMKPSSTIATGHRRCCASTTSSGRCRGVDEVLVRVHASTVTRGDAMGVRSREYKFARLLTGIRRPRRTSFGSEFAGRVEEVGVGRDRAPGRRRRVRRPGGARTRSTSTVGESGVIAPKPDGLTYEEAAAIPDGSLLALSCLRPAEPLQGKSVLVYGAAGSVGTAAVQLLVHHFGPPT